MSTFLEDSGEFDDTGSFGAHRPHFGEAFFAEADATDGREANDGFRNPDGFDGRHRFERIIAPFFVPETQASFSPCDDEIAADQFATQTSDGDDFGTDGEPGRFLAGEVCQCFSSGPQN